MTGISPISAALIVLSVGSLVVAVLTMRGFLTRRTSGAPAATKRLQFSCTICSRDLAIRRDDLRILSGPEMGLAVRADPQLAGRKLGEYACPNCEAAHCFTLDEKVPVWVGVNLYVPEQKGTRCLECRNPVRVPPWSPGQYDGNVASAPSMDRDYGLICPRCQSVVCVGCSEDHAQKHPDKGNLVCPRCHRGPIDRFFHPEFEG
jgi:hypothetical protein